MSDPVTGPVDGTADDHDDGEEDADGAHDLTGMLGVGMAWGAEANVRGPTVAKEGGVVGHVLLPHVKSSTPCYCWPCVLILATRRVHHL